MEIATVPEVAAFLRMKESTVRGLASRGVLPGYKLGKSWRFDITAIRNIFLASPAGNARHQEETRSRKGEMGRNGRIGSSEP